MTKKESGGGKVKGRSVTLWPKWVRLAFRIVARSVGKASMEDVTGKEMAEALKVPTSTTAHIAWTQIRAAAQAGDPDTMRVDYVTIAVERLMELDTERHDPGYYHPDSYSPHATPSKAWSPDNPPSSSSASGSAPSLKLNAHGEPPEDDEWAWHAEAARKAFARGKSDLLAGYLERLRGMNKADQLAFLKDFVRSLS